MWAGFALLRLQALANMVLNFECHRMQINCRLDEWPLASKGRLCSMDLLVHSHFEDEGKKSVQNNYYEFYLKKKRNCILFSAFFYARSSGENYYLLHFTAY
jgi:hypothetical protein